MSIKLIVADGNVNFVSCVQKSLSTRDNIEVVGAALDGNVAFDLIKRKKPDVLLMEFILGGKDSLALMRDIHSLPNYPAIIICTKLHSELVSEAANSYNASYVMFKPVDMDSLYRAIIDTARMSFSMVRSDLISTPAYGSLSKEQFIQRQIWELDIPTRMAGYSYMEEALKLALDDSKRLKNLKNGIYAEVAKKFSTSPESVERGIRNAISIAHTRGKLSQFIGNRPTNKQFLSYAVNRLSGMI